MQCNIENIFMNAIKHFRINQISIWSSWYAVKQPNQTKLNRMEQHRVFTSQLGVNSRFVFLFLLKATGRRERKL